MNARMAQMLAKRDSMRHMAAASPAVQEAVEAAAAADLTEYL